MSVSYLDVVYRKLLLTKFFTKGWGKPGDLQRIFNFRRVMSNREACYYLIPKDYPIKVTNSQIRGNCRVIEGKFRSPFAQQLPGLVSSEIHDAVFQMILPLKWSDNSFKPVCIHLAGTGDHFFWRRRYLMVKSLIENGIGAIILENPYYGYRKPLEQIRSSVHYVSDIFVMGGCLISECIALLNWCEQLGFGPLGVTGISMGGHMASLAASNWPKPLVLVPCLSWSTASSVFTEGVMSESIDWDMLQNQYFSEKLYCEELSKRCKIVDDPFACSLTKNFSDYAIQYEKDTSKYLKSTYVTPYEIINHLKISESESDCRAIIYKAGHKKLRFMTNMNTITKLNFFKPSSKVVEMKKRATEALWFMRGMMDECTHLKNFSVPFDTSLIISVTAQTDGYVPRKGVSRLDEIWPGATVKYLNCGHVGAYIWYRYIFRDAIVEAFNKAKNRL